MLYLIDGTGPFFDSEYAVDMAGSFCGQLQFQLGKNRCSYRRGPSALGMEVPALVTATTNEILNQRQSGGSDRVFLGGYSRGAHAVRLVAWELKQRKIDVQAMFLFDSVDREPWSSSNPIKQMDKIPSNVKNCYHAVREYEPLVNLLETNNKLQSRDLWEKIKSAFGLSSSETRKQWSEARDAINKLATDRIKNPNRETKGRHSRGITGIGKGALNLDFYNFGNTGMEAEAPCSLHIKKFDGSHGALGGVPWPDNLIPGDAKKVAPVRTWMWSKLRQEGVLS